MLLTAVPTLLVRNIVVATDFSHASDMALGYARAIALRYSAKITLVHAIHPDEKAEREGILPAEEIAEAEQNLRAEADHCPDVQCHIRLVKGTALEVVDQILAIEQVDLIVVGTHGKHGFQRMLAGSAAEQIFRHVHCPVLVIGPSVVESAPDWKPKKILLATDLETDESRTLEYAMAMAAQHHAELALLHVTPPAAAPFPEDTESFLKPYFRARLRKLMPSWAGIEHPQFWIEFGSDPVTETMRVIAEQGIDLVVLSVHPGEPWTTHFHHDAPRIVAEAPCPVLVVQRRF